MIKINHHFTTACPDIDKLFNNVVKMSQFKSNLEKMSTKYKDRYDEYKFVGDGFEMFVECFIKIYECDNRVGISDYEVIQVGNDNGVDGYGNNIDGEPCAVQVKFRSNTTKNLTATEDKLDSFIAESVISRQIIPIPKTQYKHFVFTTANDLHYYTDNEKFRNTVYCFGWDRFRQMVDNNKPFWNKLREIILENLTFTKEEVIL